MEKLQLIGKSFALNGAQKFTISPKVRLLIRQEVPAFVIYKVYEFNSLGPPSATLNNGYLGISESPELGSTQKG